MAQTCSVSRNPAGIDGRVVCLSGSDHSTVIICAELETTATYDATTAEFVINSPTVSSTKWWIGALGLLATHGVVQARLILNGRELGPHLFIVQRTSRKSSRYPHSSPYLLIPPLILMTVRSLNDHSLMPNVSIGEIGPKVLGV